MSLWDNMKFKFKPYAEDEYDDFDDEEGFEPAEEEAETASGRRMPAFSVPANGSESASGGFSGQVVNMGNRQEVVLFHPANFNDTSKAADHLRSKRAVIVNMENVDKAMARRVVDFLSGCAYAVDGKVKKVAQSTYLFCPHNMDIMGDLENMQAEAETYV